MATGRVVVVGGGIAGLTTALAAADGGWAVTVLEATDRWGGQLRSRRAHGCVIEEGAEAFAVGAPAMQRLIDRLGVADQVVRQRNLPSYLLLNGDLRALAAGEAAALLSIRSDGAESAGLATMAGGMETLATALHAALAGRADLVLRRAVRALDPDGAGWRLIADAGTITADRIVLAVPAPAAAALLETPVPDAAAPLTTLAARSSLTVSLVWPRDGVAHPLDATGFVVSPESTGTGQAAACTFASSKFPGRAPDARALLRVFFRPDASGLTDTPDREWVERAQDLLAPVLGLAGEPLAARVSRWPGALPVHGPDYAAAVTRAERMLDDRGIGFAGSAWHAPGVEGAVRSAWATADALTD